VSDLPAFSVPRFRLGLDLLMDDFRVPSMYRLDNAAIIMPPVTNGDSTSLFRLSVEMDEEVDQEKLQTALDRTVKRFPYLAVQLKRGFFWYKLEPAEKPITVEEDPQSPCLGLDPNVPGTCLMRVRSKGRRIACEMSHLMADGRGGMRFTKTLVAEV